MGDMHSVQNEPLYTVIMGLLCYHLRPMTFPYNYFFHFFIVFWEQLSFLIF